MNSNYVPLTPQSSVGDLREETPDLIEEWTTAVRDTISRKRLSPNPLSTPRASPVQSSLSFSSPSPPATPVLSSGVTRRVISSSPLLGTPAPRKRRLPSECDPESPPPLKRARCLPACRCPPNPPESPVSTLTAQNELDLMTQTFLFDPHAIARYGLGGELDPNELLDIHLADFGAFPCVPEEVHGTTEAPSTPRWKEILSDGMDLVFQTASNDPNFHDSSREQLPKREWEDSALLGDCNLFSPHG
jgi:hypothetical protein